MGFRDDLWKITPPFLKRTLVKEESDIWIWLTVLGLTFDKAREKVYLVRRQALVPTAVGKALDAHGDERRLPRFPGENDESYRSRLLNFQEYYLYSGTKRGIISALKANGYPDAIFYPLYKEKYVANPNPDYLGKWSQFIIKITIPEEKVFLANNLKALGLVINDVRPPESKLYAFVLYVAATHTNANSFDFKLTTNKYWFLDGAYLLDGTKTLGAEVTIYDPLD